MNDSFASVERVELDAIDLRILAQLQEDASLSNQSLAEKVHVSAATCLRRVKRLLDVGLIERQVAILSPERVGHGLTAIIEITLDHQAAEHLAAFETRAAADATVQQCYRVSPGPDFVLIVQVADMAGYNAFVQRMLSLDANVRNVRTFFSTHRAKFGTQMVLPIAPVVRDKTQG
ncbi:MAG: AsnC family transcriptional regulator [Rhodocyclales bacterium]|nr:AsnC family transcriptional regulator [Rhodocyclales bacterium]